MLTVVKYDYAPGETISSPIAYLTSDGYLWLTADTHPLVQIVHLETSKTSKLDFLSGTVIHSFTGTSDGKVIVGLTFQNTTDRFEVFTSTGTLLHYLKFTNSGYSSRSLVSANKWQSPRVAIHPSDADLPIQMYHYMYSANRAANIEKTSLWLHVMILGVVSSTRDLF